MPPGVDPCICVLLTDTGNVSTGTPTAYSNSNTSVTEKKDVSSDQMRVGTGVLRRKVIPCLFFLLSLCRTGVLRRKVISDCSFCCLYVELVCCDVK